MWRSKQKVMLNQCEIAHKRKMKLLIKLEDSKREMVEKLTHVKIQTKSYTESMRNSSQEIFVHWFSCHHGRNQNLKVVDKKEKKLRSEDLIMYGVDESSGENKGDTIKFDDDWISMYFRLYFQFMWNSTFWLGVKNFKNYRQNG